MVMTESVLRQICREQDLYTTPSLNEVLYCNFRGFSQIGGLEQYTALRSLFLEGNALSALDGLPAAQITCLYLQNNQISCLKGLSRTPELRVLNLSSNRLSSLDGLNACPLLTTLICGDNLLELSSSLTQLSLCTALETLDVQANRLEDPAVVEIFASLPQLRSLYVKGNPFVDFVRPLRKSLVSAVPTLTYLDDRPVSELERLCAEAWRRGGAAAEDAAKRYWRQAAVLKEAEHFEALQAMRQESFRKRREQLGLPPGEMDPFHDIVDATRTDVGHPPEPEAPESWQSELIESASGSGSPTGPGGICEGGDKSGEPSFEYVDTFGR